MFNKRKYRAELYEKSEKLTPQNPYPEKSINSAKPRWFWPLVSTGSALLIAGVVALSCYEGGLFGNKTAKNELLINPTLTKIQKQPTRAISQATYDSYMAFASKFTKMAFASAFEDGEKSFAVSIPDAYLCLALTGIVSSTPAEADILSFLSLGNEQELKTAAKEIVASLCTLKANDDGSYSGGYNLNSLWFDPAQVELLAKDETLYQDLADIFDTSVYLRALKSAEANAYLAEKGLKDLPTPKVSLDDDHPFAASVMSVFYCLDSFPLRDLYKDQYTSGTHKMSYTQNGVVSEENYIRFEKDVAPVYEGKGFTGASAWVHQLQMSYFLPDALTGSPYGILNDVLASAYTKKSYLKEGLTRDDYQLTIDAPYFRLNNRSVLNHETLAKVLPVISEGGMSEKMVTSKLGAIYLSQVLQQSVMTFDYQGFYSASLTIAGGEPTSAPTGDQYLLSLDHPYLFQVAQPVVKVSDSYQNIPLVIGEIIDPAYEK